mmetsp:Transcript_19901/g.42448  ORF Transcript_19901/g.42448 Transcript_19901/m.42448 type:complete len:458 (+) Transcript_19901:73-1446(+)
MELPAEGLAPSVRFETEVERPSVRAWVQMLLETPTMRETVARSMFGRHARLDEHILTNEELAACCAELCLELHMAPPTSQRLERALARFDRSRGGLDAADFDLFLCSLFRSALARLPQNTAADMQSLRPWGNPADLQETYLRPIGDLDAVRACFQRHGVVGVTGVLDSGECGRLISEGLEPFLPAGCQVDDVTTHGLADRALNRYGVYSDPSRHGVLFNPAILAARLHPNVIAAYSAVYGCSDVYACHDRAAWMRPALHNKQWDTPFVWPGLHFDVNLRGFFEGTREEVDDYLSARDYEDGGFVGENNAKHVSMGPTVQGVLSLLDNVDEDGGFHCVPGMFGQSLQAWAQAHPGLPEKEANGRYDLKSFGPDAELGAQAIRVPCPAGTLLLFDATLPHGTRPNASNRSRVILFLRYISQNALPGTAWRRRNAALRRISREVDFEPDERQRRHLYGPE